mgnify:FL=1
MGEEKQTALVKSLYCTAIGRVILKMIIRPWFSKTMGWFLDTKISKFMIKGFVRRNGIDLSLYEKSGFDSYGSFNEFFTRKIKSGCRPVSMDHADLIAPCDGLLSIHPVTDQSVEIKGHYYTISELVQDEGLQEKYINGVMMVFRLTVSDCHRYHYPDNGVKSANTKIKGVFHTVHPVAAQKNAIYCENSREYFILNSDNFGDMLMIQVGALLVGKICNKHSHAVVQRGFEAGWFEYGGSTVIMCLEQGAADLLPGIMQTGKGGTEVRVNMGQVIGRAAYGNE